MLNATKGKATALQHISSVFIAMLFSLFLLAVPQGGYAAIMDFKYVLFLLICGGYCAVIIVVRVQLALIGAKPLENPKKVIKEIPLAMKLLFLFLFFTILSSILSEYSGTFTGAFRREGVLTIAIYVLGCSFVSTYFRPQKWMFYLLGVSTCLFCILSLAQLCGANPFMLYPEGHNYFGANVYYPGQFIGTIGNAGISAAFISIVIAVFSMTLIKYDHKERWLLSIPLLLAVFLVLKMTIDAGIIALGAGFLLMLPVAVTDQKSLSRFLFVMAIVVTAFTFSQAIVLTEGSAELRSGRLMLLTVSGFAALLGYAAKKGKWICKLSKKWYRIGTIAVVLLVICLALIFLWFYAGDASSGGMIYEASEALHGRWEDSFGSWRGYIWRGVLSGITPRSLLLGTGPDTLGHWVIPSSTRYNEELGATVVSRIDFDAAHNEYLNILATGGILSLLCYLGALASAMVQWYRNPDTELSAVAGAGVMFYCIQAFYGISMCITAPFFWTGLAVLIQVPHPART